MKDNLAYDTSGYGVLLERIVHQNDILLKNMGEMRDLVRQIPFIKAKVIEHDAKFGIVIAAMQDLSKIVQNHDVRITRLERTA